MTRRTHATRTPNDVLDNYIAVDLWHSMRKLEQRLMNTCCCCYCCCHCCCCCLRFRDVFFSAYFPTIKFMNALRTIAIVNFPITVELTCASRLSNYTNKFVALWLLFSLQNVWLICFVIRVGILLSVDIWTSIVQLIFVANDCYFLSFSFLFIDSGIFLWLHAIAIQQHVPGITSMWINFERPHQNHHQPLQINPSWVQQMVNIVQWTVTSILKFIMICVWSMAIRINRARIHLHFNFHSINKIYWKWI